MVEQIPLEFDDEDSKNFRGIFQRTFWEMKKKFPRIKDESIEDYVEMLKYETFMEVAEKIRKMAQYRDNLNIQLKYEEWKHKNDGQD